MASLLGVTMEMKKDVRRKAVDSEKDVSWHQKASSTFKTRYHLLSSVNNIMYNTIDL